MRHSRECEDQLYREVAEESPGKLIHASTIEGVTVEEYMHVGAVIRCYVRNPLDPSQTSTSYRKTTMDDYARQFAPKIA